MLQLTPELVRAETDYRTERARVSFPGRRLAGSPRSVRPQPTDHRR